MSYSTPGFRPNEIIFDEKYQDEFIRLIEYPAQWNDKLPAKRIFSKQGLRYIGGPDSSILNLVCYSCKCFTIINLKTVFNIGVLHHINCKLENNQEIIENGNMKEEKQRLLTYLSINWPYSVDPRNLAKYGFYWKGQNDLSACFTCNLEIQGWSIGDNAENEHRKWNAFCPFLNGLNVGNIPLNSLQLNLNDPPSDPTLCDKIQLSKIGNQNYITYEKRKDSYSFWPLSLSHKVSTLALAGFYYTGRGDRVICFCCNGGLKDWSGDNPWIEHIVHYPNCEYIKKSCSSEYIAWVNDIRKSRITNKNKNVNETSASTSSADADGPPETALANLDTEQEAINKRVCKLCFEKEIGIVFIPCSHMVTCQDCATQINRCPLCRKTTVAVVKAILP